MHAVPVPTPIPCVYVSTPVQLATTRTKNPAKHANHVYLVLTTMKLEKHCAKNVLVVDIHLLQNLVKQHQRAKEQDAAQEHFLLKLVLSHRQNANLAEQERTVMKSEERRRAKKHVLQVLSLLKLVKQQQQLVENVQVVNILPKLVLHQIQNVKEGAVSVHIQLK